MVKGTTRPGVAIDLPFWDRPTGVELRLDKTITRDYRANVPSRDNAMLNEIFWNNDVWNSKAWKGNGFVGHVAYVQNCITRAPIRPCHLDKDLQRPTFPKECTMPLNTSQMPDGAIPLDARTEGSADNVNKHNAIVDSMRQVRARAKQHQKDATHFNYFGVLNEQKVKEQAIKRDAQNFRDIRPAGMGSINPAIGTAGNIPNLNNMKGPQAFETWRTIAPWGWGGNFASGEEQLKVYRRVGDPPKSRH